MKLSEMNPADVMLVKAGQAAQGESREQPKALKLSELKPDEVQIVQATKGVQVYDQPVGPEQASAVDRVIERVQDPARWEAIVKGTGPYVQKVNGNAVVQGDVPMVLPGGAIPKLTKAAVALAEGKGIGYMLGRTALSTAQGGAMSYAQDGPEGETFGEKVDRVKSNAKLSGGIQAAAEALPVAGKFVKAARNRIGSWASGVDESLISNYSTRTDQVNKVIRDSGGDMTEAADQVRTELTDGIQKAKGVINSTISNTLKGSSKEPTISIKPILERLKQAKANLNPNFKASEITEIDEMIASIQREASSTNADGLVSPTQLYEIKKFLREGSKGSYNKGGQIFMRGGDASRAAKGAAGEASDMIAIHTPEIAQADRQLSKLHNIEGRLNKNILAPGKPDGALMAAGSGANARNAATLRELEKFSGVPVSQRAKDLATAKVFAKPSITPVDGNGKAAARILIGGGIGYGVGDAEGAAIGAGLMSPLAIKAGINVGNVAGKLGSQFPNVAKAVRDNPVAAQAVTQIVKGQIDRANPPNRDELGQPKLGKNLKGEDRWAARGVEKLGIDRELASSLMSSKEGKRLLIEASDMSPGSAGLSRILKRIEAMKGQSHDSRTTSSPAVPRLERKPSSGR